LKLGDYVGYLAFKLRACVGSSNIHVIIANTFFIGLASACSIVGRCCVTMSLIRLISGCIS
jgi:hypothetical protein